MNDARERNSYALMLGLPEDLVDPDYYQLLNLPRFSSDQKAIFTAIVTQYAKCLPWQNADQHHKEAKRIMEELGSAKIILLDEKTKRDYDRQLKSGKSKASRLISTGKSAEPLEDILDDPMMDWITDDLINQVGDFAKQLERSRRKTRLPPRQKRKRKPQRKTRPAETEKPVSNAHYGLKWNERLSVAFYGILFIVPVMIALSAVLFGIGYMGFVLYMSGPFGQFLVLMGGAFIAVVLITVIALHMLF